MIMGDHGGDFRDPISHGGCNVYSMYFEILCRYQTILQCFIPLTHWGLVTHICISTSTIIGSDNGLLPGMCQAIIWTNGGILLIGPLTTTFSEISIKIQTFSFKEMHFKMSPWQWRPFCLGLNVLMIIVYIIHFFQLFTSGMILGLHPASERRCYKVTPSLIGWAQT